MCASSYSPSIDRPTPNQSTNRLPAADRGLAAVSGRLPRRYGNCYCLTGKRVGKGLAVSGQQNTCESHSVDCDGCGLLCKTPNVQMHAAPRVSTACQKPSASVLAFLTVGKLFNPLPVRTSLYPSCLLIALLPDNLHARGECLDFRTLD